MRGMLDRGFTTVRDVGGAPFALAEAVEQGLGRRSAAGGLRQGAFEDRRPRRRPRPQRSARAKSLAAQFWGAWPDRRRRPTRCAARRARNYARARSSSRSWPMAASPARPTRSPGKAIPRTRSAPSSKRRATRETYVSAHLYTAEAIARAMQAACTAWNTATASTRQPRTGGRAGCVAVPTLVTYEALATMARGLACRRRRSPRSRTCAAPEWKAWHPRDGRRHDGLRHRSAW